jgi:two-component system cell cycle sensor histidine kinase/response regulator CckA
MEVLFNFTLDNWIGILLALIPALMNFAILFYILLFLPKNGICYSFSLFVASLAIWQTSDALVRLSAGPETAMLWYEFLGIGALMITPAGLHFVFLFIENDLPLAKKITESPLALFLLYAPVIFCFSLNHVTTNKGTLTNTPLWGWQTNIQNDIAILIEGIWVSTLALTIIIILFSYARKIRHNREKYFQTLLIAGGFTLPTIIGILTQIIFPVYLNIPPIPVSSTIMSIFSISTLIAFTHFRLFKISSSVAASTILETIKDIVVIVNPQQKLEFINAKGAEILGINPDKVEDMYVDELFSKESKYYERFIEDIWNKVIKGKYAESYATVLLKQENIEIPVLLSVVPIPITINYHTLPSILLVARDITELKKSETQLLEQAELLDKAQDAIIVRDLDYNIIYWNKSAERLYGWTRAEILGNDGPDKFYLEKTDEMIEAAESILKKDEWLGELNQLTKSGTRIIVQSRWNLIHNNAGKPKSILTVNTDITEKKQIEGQLLRSQRMESIGTLTGGIAHDLNNVLSPIMMAVEILKMNLSDKKKSDVLSILETSVKRGSEIIKQLLIFARGDIEKEQTTIEINQLTENIIKIIKGTFSKSIMHINCISENIWPVMGDITQLEQVLLNICVNARDAMPDGGQLRIKAENVYIDDNFVRINIEAKVGSYVLIEVNDTGMGIAPDIIDKIFEPFFTTKEIGKGTGLGLSALRGIIKSHGGFVIVTSIVGKGTSFKLYLPAKKPVKSDSVIVPETEPEQINDKFRGNGELILVADDEISLLEMLKTTLGTFGYDVLTAENGVEAIEIYKENKNKVKVVVTDVSMPVMDGLMATKELQRIDPLVKVILTSGLTTNNYATEVLSNNNYLFLQKPYTTSDLLMKINDILKN